MLDRDTLHALPKTDLHVHLDGSLRFETLCEMIEKERPEGIPTEEPEIRRRLHIGARCDSLEQYLEAFEVTLSVLQTEENLYRAAYELVEDAARENVWYMEIRYSPALHTRRGLSPVDIVEVVRRATARASHDYDIRTGLIICGIRNMDPRQSLALAKLTIAFKNRGVVGFDLAGAENQFPARDHIESFELITKNNISSTIHAGEAYGPDSIRQALHYCSAQRIGHGTRLIEDGDLLNYMNDRRIPLEICLLSNVQVGAARDLESHPFPLFFRYGLRTTLNTDNRLITDTTVTREFETAVASYGLDERDVERIVKHGFKSAFIPYREKRELLKLVDRRCMELLGTRGGYG